MVSWLWFWLRFGSSFGCFVNQKSGINSIAFGPGSDYSVKGLTRCIPAPDLYGYAVEAPRGQPACLKMAEPEGLREVVEAVLTSQRYSAPGQSANGRQRRQSDAHEKPKHPLHCVLH